MHLSSYETENTENKTVSYRTLPQNLWESISAFSNAEGGMINLGIDPSGNIIGIEMNSIDQLQRDIVTLCSSGFNHKLYPDITVTESQVISIHIPPVPSSMRPIYSLS